jgi:hypothetical protein
LCLAWLFAGGFALFRIWNLLQVRKH